VLVVLALALAGAGCGGDDGDTDEASVEDTSTTTETVPEDSGDDAVGSDVGDFPDPCALLSSAELVEATGQPFGEGTFNEDLSNQNQAICDWISEDPFATAQVLISSFGDIDSQRESVEESFGEETVDVDLTEGAYRTAEGSLVAMSVGDWFVQVSYIPSGPGSVGDTTVGLAEKVLSRL
jgi:hypothetical protein